MLVDSYKFLPRSFRPLYEGRGPFPGEESPVWTPFAKRLSESRLALLSSAGIYLKASQLTFDLDREQEHPEWGDPTWRSIPATARPEDIAVAHLHINDEDLLADPEIALPMRGLDELALRVLAGAQTFRTRIDLDVEWPVPVREAYRAWQPKVPSPIVRKLLETRSRAST